MGTLKLNKKVSNEDTLRTDARENNAAKVQEGKNADKVNATGVEMCELAKQDDKFVEEIENMRAANETIYRRNDNTCRKIITPAPTRYRGEDGKFKEISNRLKENCAEIINEGNAFKVKFDKDSRSGKIFDLQRGNKAVSLSVADTLKLRNHSCGCKCEICSDEEDTVTATMDDGTEIQYITLNDRIKENIIVKERKENYEYNFTLNIGDLQVEEGQNNNLLLKNAETGETEFMILAPYMYDANNNRSDKVRYEIDVNGEELAIKVVADPEFINREGRAFPVIIDPTTVVSTSSVFEFMTEDYTYGEPESSYYYNTLSANDSSDHTSDVHATITVFKDKIPAVSGPIEKVELELKSMPNAKGYFTFDGTLYRSYSSSSYTFDITKKFIKSNGSFTLDIYADVDSNGNDYSCIEFYTSDSYMPKLKITYVTAEGEVNFPTVKSFPLFDRTEAYVNLHNGYNMLSFGDFSGAFSVPFALSHIFVGGVGDNTFGYNWRLNTDRQLKLDESDSSGSTKYLYIDEFGSRYVFEERYYYLSGSAKVYVAKNAVSINSLGEITYYDPQTHKDQKVYKEQNCCPQYTLVPQLNDFIYSPFIEQRQKEQIELEDYINSCKSTLKNYVLASRDGGNILMRLSDIYKEGYSSFLARLDSSYTYIVISEGEAMQLQGLYLNKKQLENERKEYYIQIDEYRAIMQDPNSSADKYKEAQAKMEVANKKIDYSWEQHSVLNSQINNIIHSTSWNMEILQPLIVKYLQKEEELEELYRQTPVAYLKDENGIYSGFNRDGRLVLVFDEDNNYAAITYSSENLPKQIVDSRNYALTFEYEDGKLSQISDSSGKKINYTYDSNKLTQVDFSDGSKLNFEYDSNGITRIASDNYQSKLSYASNKLSEIKTTAANNAEDIISNFTVSFLTAGIKVADNDGNEEYFRFDANKRIIRYQKVDNTMFKHFTNYAYETTTNGKKITTQKFNSSSTQVTVETTEYDNLGKITAKTQDWLNVSETVKVKTQTQYTYNADDKLVKETTTKSVDDAGVITDNVYITEYRYDAYGRKILTISYTQGEEETKGKTIQQTEYDENGRAYRTVSWNSLDSSSKFYSESRLAENGQAVAEIGETGEKTAEYEYESGNGAVKSVTYPNGGKLAYGRNPDNDLVTSITQSTEDGEANVTDIVYQNNLPVKVKSGNTTIEYTYAQKDREKTVTVNGNLQCEFTYEDYKKTSDSETLFAKTVEKLHLGDEVITCEYVKNGVLDTETKRMAVTESYKIGDSVQYTKSYNTKGECTQVDYCDETAKTLTYTYNNRHKVTEVQLKSGEDSVLSERYAYTGYGELRRKGYFGAVSQDYAYIYKNNAARDFDYVSFSGYKFKPLTDVNGRNTGKEIYNGENKIAAEYITYRKVGDHATNMPATVWFGSGSDIKDSIKYKYDSCGNICEIRENGHLVAKYTYDSLNRLVREDNRACNITFIFSYDQCGNITERCEYDYTLMSGEELAELDCTHYSYDYDGDKLVNYNGEAFAYNNLGNPTTYRNNAVEWQYGKRLVKLGETTFAYDGLGRRTKKGDITFVYDSDGRLMKQSDGLEFVYDNAGVIGFKYSDAQYFYRRDVQGNIIAILDSNGNVVVKYVYDAWGNNVALDANGAQVVDGVGVLNPFRYRGYYYDTETELYYLQTRYYDPELGRFISQDSLEYADPETINGLNLYAYCYNNPNKYIDFRGNIPIANFITKFTISKTFDGLYSKLWGRIGYTASITKQDKETGFFYASKIFDISDLATNWAVGINAWDWLGIEVGVNKEYNLTISGNITPWFHCGLEVGLSGINITLGINIDDTSHDITFGIGLGLVAVAAGAAAVVVSGGSLLEPVLNFFRMLFA